MKVSRTGVFVSAAPGLLALVLFYTLAIHMHWSLGDWPSGIGENGFPPALLIHANVATTFFWVAIMVSLFILPVALGLCLLVSNWRHLIAYLLLYALAGVVCVACMQLAPKPFLNWWMD